MVPTLWRERQWNQANQQWCGPLFLYRQLYSHIQLPKLHLIAVTDRQPVHTIHQHIDHFVRSNYHNSRLFISRPRRIIFIVRPIICHYQTGLLTRHHNNLNHSATRSSLFDIVGWRTVSIRWRDVQQHGTVYAVGEAAEIWWAFENKR